ncbi:unnamed protein product [[Candida] boidinii]|nr:unnamed protein product [[Candida] boidinii]
MRNPTYTKEKVAELLDEYRHKLGKGLFWLYGNVPKKILDGRGNLLPLDLVQTEDGKSANDELVESENSLELEKPEPISDVANAAVAAASAAAAASMTNIAPTASSSTSSKSSKLSKKSKDGENIKSSKSHDKESHSKSDKSSSLEKTPTETPIDKEVVTSSGMADETTMDPSLVEESGESSKSKSSSSSKSSKK